MRAQGYDTGQPSVPGRHEGLLRLLHHAPATRDTVIWLVAVLSLVVFWGLCSIYVYGRALAYFWCDFPTLQSDKRWCSTVRWARFFSLMGPFGVPSTLLGGGFKHGLLYRRPL